MLEGSTTRGAALELRASERTKELSEVDRALQQSNDDLLQFAHVASHDLKEPLRKIKTFANRVYHEERECLSEKARMHLDKILSSASRMTNMIEGVLAYSEINGVQQVIEEVSLNDVVRNVHDDLEVLIADKNATIEYEDLPPIYGTEFLINQLFYNIINNALKFSRDEEPCKIHITAEKMYDGAESWTEISIEDNGIGFDPSFAERIFSPFIRLNSKDEYEGTGLGLALCKKIVERHNGKIYASGQKCRGAKFRIALPNNIQQIKKKYTRT